MIPVDFMEDNDGLLSVFRLMYNSVARLFSHKATWVSEYLVNMFRLLTARRPVK